MSINSFNPQNKQVRRARSEFLFANGKNWGKSLGSLLEALHQMLSKQNSHPGAWAPVLRAAMLH